MHTTHKIHGSLCHLKHGPELLNIPSRDFPDMEFSCYHNRTVINVWIETDVTYEYITYIVDETISGNPCSLKTPIARGFSALFIQIKTLVYRCYPLIEQAISTDH
jgi:hypothetical protein